MDKIKLTAGVFILLLAVGTTYFIAQEDNAYFCEDENSVGLCWKLSKINDAGLQTRCYYNESNPTKYNYCKTGWVVYESSEVTGEPIQELDGIIIDIDLNDKEILLTKGIGKKEIRNQTCIEYENMTCIQRDNSLLGYSYPIISECIKIDEFCKSRVFQQGGINKDIKVPYKDCVEYFINETTNETGECLDWYVLTVEELQIRLKEEVENQLRIIAENQRIRESEVDINLTNKFELII